MYGCYCDCIGADNTGDCWEGEEGYKAIDFSLTCNYDLKKSKRGDA